MAIEMTPTQIQKADFPQSRKGYDPDAVRAHLRDAAAALESALRRAKVAEDAQRRAEENAASGAAQVAAAAVPQEQQVADETARVLMAAREAAASMEEQARESVEVMVGDAQGRAGQLIADSEAQARQIIEDAQAKAGAMLAEAEQANAGAQARYEQETSGILNEARTQAEEIISEARAQADQIVASAEAEKAQKLAEIESKSAHLEEKRQAAIAELEAKRSKALSEIEERKAELVALKAGAGSAKKQPAAKKAPTSGPVSRPIPSGEVPAGAAKAASKAGTAKKSVSKPPPATKAKPSGDVDRMVEAEAEGEGKDFDQLFGRFQQGEGGDQAEGEEEAAAAAANSGPVAPIAETVEMKSPMAAEAAPGGIAMEEQPSGLSMEMPAPSGPATAMPDEEDSKVLGVLRKQLLRKLKRGLQDEQNTVIEALRQSGGAVPAAQLVPRPADSLRRVHRTIDQVLVELAKLGWSTGGGAGAAPKPPTMDELLMGSLLSPLATETGNEIDSGRTAGEDVSQLSERVNNVYRNWKGPGLADLAASLANEAFMGGRAAVAS